MYFFFIGLGLLAISLFLVNKKNDKCPITPKWLLFVFLSFTGNGLCSTFQKMQQIAFGGAYKNEFMIISLAIVVFVNGAATLVTNKGDFPADFSRRHRCYIFYFKNLLQGKSYKSTVCRLFNRDYFNSIFKHLK